MLARLKNFLIKKKNKLKNYLNIRITRLRKNFKRQIIRFKKILTYSCWKTKLLDFFPTCIRQLKNFFKFVFKIIDFLWWLLLLILYIQAIIVYCLIWMCGLIVYFISLIPYYFTRTVDTILSIINLFWRLVVYFWLLKWALFLPPRTVFSIFAGLLTHVIIIIVVYVLRFYKKADFQKFVKPFFLLLVNLFWPLNICYWLLRWSFFLPPLTLLSFFVGLFFDALIIITLFYISFLSRE